MVGADSRWNGLRFSLLLGERAWACRVKEFSRRRVRASLKCCLACSVPRQPVESFYPLRNCRESFCQGLFECCEFNPMMLGKHRKIRIRCLAMALVQPGYRGS